MPYELVFSKRLQIDDRTRYVNACCVGGDIVSAALLPALRERYGDIDAGQEDWGWFIWFEANGLRLAVDVHTDDAMAGQFRIRLATSRRGRLLGRREVDTADLDELKRIVCEQLEAWVGSPPLVMHVD